MRRFRTDTGGKPAVQTTRGEATRSTGHARRPRLDERRLVTGDPIPTLDDLSQAAEPAWLWDAERLRVVWANRGAIVMWGGETLFDLIDRRFSTADPGVARLGELFKQLAPGQWTDSQLAFADVADALPFQCRCHAHKLSDGRPGLLIIAAAPVENSQALDGGLGHQALEALPSALVLTDRQGQLMFCNAAARELWAHRIPAHLADIVGDEAVADRIIGRAVTTGIASEVLEVPTRFGMRDHRVHLQALPEDEAQGHLLAQFEDVAERRELEQDLRDHVDRLSDFVAAAATLTWQLDADLRFRSFDGDSADDLIGQSWAEAAVQLGIDVSGGIAAAMADRDAWRAEVDWSSGGTTQRIYLSAVPVFELDGTFSGYRGIGAPVAVHLESPGIAAPEAQDATVSDDAPAPDTEAPAAEGRMTAEEAMAFRQIGKKLADEEPPAEEETSEAAETEEPEEPEEREHEAPAADPPCAPEPVEIGPDDAELRTILDTATDGVLTLDHRGRIESLNASAQAIFGYDTQEAVGRPLFELLTKESAKTVRDYLAALSDSGLARIFNDGREIVAVERQGGEIPLFVTIGRIYSQTGRDEGKAKYCAVIRDITQWKRTEVELRTAKEQAERANAQKSEFLANISHELRTPLNAIIGFSEVMKTEKFGTISNDRYKGYVTDIHASGEHLLSLINDLLDLSKVEAGKLELNFTSVDLSDIIQQCIGIIQELATRERIIIRTSVADRLPNVVADHRSMRQILLNLLSNAVKFTDKGGQVIVSALLDEDGQVKLLVKDTGCGMTADELLQAMEPFQRVERTQMSEKPGTGLGLPLTKALAEANRASFDIESEPGKGTRVQITFPTTRVLAD